MPEAPPDADCHEALLTRDILRSKMILAGLAAPRFRDQHNQATAGIAIPHPFSDYSL